MSRTKQWLGAVSSLALVAMSATPAFAEGTASGTSVTNNVSVSYNVGGVAQTAKTATDTFLVDRKVNLTVAPQTASSNVSAKSTQQVRQFTVTNLTNAAAGFALSVAQTGGFTLTNMKIFNDANSNGAYDAGEDITFIDRLTADQSRNVWVVFDVPDVANGLTADIILTAKAAVAGTGSIGALLTATPGADNQMAVDTVLADAAGVTDAQYAGDHSGKHTLTINAAALTATKVSRVVWDPVNLFTNPKRIPGAKIEYCITVANASGAATAQAVTVSDPLPTDVTFLPDIYAGTGDITAGAVTLDSATSTCTGGNANDKTYTATTTTVGHNLGTIAAGGSAGLYFQVTVK